MDAAPPPAHTPFPSTRAPPPPNQWSQVSIFHLGSGRLVAQLPGHRINVRDLNYDPARNVLATCSFDKTVKLYVQQQQQGEQGEEAGEADAAEQG